MDTANLRNLDLNLLVVFNVLMQEKNVTRAATRLHLSQGAVSAALGRLRQALKDPLFERTRSGMAPTIRAQTLAPQIAQALATLDNLINPTADFNPSSSGRTFHLALSDDIEMLLVPSITATIRKMGWSVNFSFHQTNSSLWRESLESPEIDLVICASPAQLSSDYRESVLFASSYLCLFDAQHSQLSNPPALEEYLEAHHVRVSFDTRRGFVDEYFELLGRERRVDISLSHFAGLNSALNGSPLIATIPSYAAHALAKTAPLTVAPPPFQVPRHTVSLIWRVGQESDRANSWLRDFIESRIALPEIDGSIR